MKKSSSKTLFFTFMLFAFIVLAAYFFNRDNNILTPSSKSPSPAWLNNLSDQEIKTSEPNIKGSVVYLLKQSGVNELYKVTTDGQNKKIFTDGDEDLKIKSALSLTKSGKVLALMALPNQEFGGSLYLISTDGSGKKEKLIEEFASTQPPLISPNGKKIAYLIFNNAESDYGFSLYVMNLDGSNKQRIINDPISLRVLSWNPESNQLAFTKGDNSQSGVIYTIGLDGGKEEELVSFKEKIYSFDWGKDGFIFSKGPNESADINKTEVFKMNNQGKNPQRLTNNDSHENYCHFSTDEKGFSCLFIKYDKNVDITKSGEIESLDLKGENQKKLAEGNYIIGWLSQ